MTLKINGTAASAGQLTQFRTDLGAASVAAVDAAAAAAAAASQPGHGHNAAAISDFSAAVDARISAASVNALSDVSVASPSVGQVLKWNGTAWVNEEDATGGGAGATNLSFTRDATAVTVASDTGTDAVLPVATTSLAGVMSAAQATKVASIQDAAATISTSRALATTDSNTEAIVSNGVALTLDSGSLTDGTPFGGTAATGATFTLVVGTASLKLYHGGPALAGGTVISSARSQAGKITIERKGSDYILLEPVLSVPAATITASGALPARTVEDKQHVIVSVAGGAVALDCSGATGWAAGDLARGMFFRVIGGGAAKLSFTGGNVVNPDAKTFGSGQVCALVGDPSTANTVWVIG